MRGVIAKKLRKAAKSGKLDNRYSWQYYYKILKADYKKFTRPFKQRLNAA